MKRKNCVCYKTNCSVVKYVNFLKDHETVILKQRAFGGGVGEIVSFHASLAHDPSVYFLYVARDCQE